VNKKKIAQNIEQQKNGRQKRKKPQLKYHERHFFFMEIECRFRGTFAEIQLK